MQFIFNTQNLFDIVICLGPNDVSLIEKQLEHTKKNIVGYRNIYVISYDDSIRLDGCITISESLFPFSIEAIHAYLGDHKSRSGWYLQQLLKLYAGFVIPNISPRYLAIDADTFFMKPSSFILQNKCCYNYSREYHVPYFIHMANMHPSFEKIVNMSGICHHMMFETKYIKEMMNLVEEHHGGVPFYKAFMDCIPPENINASGASEYEMYFHFLVKYHPNDIFVRHLPFMNCTLSQLNDENEMKDCFYASCHHYMR